ncbi:hypothetical protein AAIH70_30165 [Neorhizobium sp. BT27B]|uniref:hypothetical protein n=1 Tax=Neorhizobium sp. BT27B TaxID=3142625 RepID=UPI003D2CE16A
MSCHNIDDRQIERPQTHRQARFEADMGPHEQSADLWPASLVILKARLAQDTTCDNKLADYLANGANGLFLGEFVAEKFGPIVVRFKNQLCGC